MLLSRRTIKSLDRKKAVLRDYGPKNTSQASIMIAQNAEKRYVHLSTISGRHFCLDRMAWTDEALSEYINTVAHAIQLITFTNYKTDCTECRKKDKVYESPVASKIPGGYNARTVTMQSFNDYKFVDALKLSTTTFYVPDDGVFACTLADKRKLVSWLRDVSRYSTLIIFWPGKYQSHAFYVKRHCGLMTKIQSLLGPTEAEKSGAVRMEALRQIRKMRAELNAMELKVNESLVDRSHPSVRAYNDEIGMFD